MAESGEAIGAQLNVDSTAELSEVEAFQKELDPNDTRQKEAGGDDEHDDDTEVED